MKLGVPWVSEFSDKAICPSTWIRWKTQAAGPAFCTAGFMALRAPLPMWRIGEPKRKSNCCHCPLVTLRKDYSIYFIGISFMEMYQSG